MSKQLQEAKQCEEKAKECLKTSMIKLKFKPDFDGAATAMERASVCYRNAGDHQKAAESLKSAADYYEQNTNYFHAAKSREGAAMMLRDKGDVSEAVKLFERAIDGYAECGSLDTAAMTVEKAAEVVRNNDPAKAIELYQKGLALVQQSDRSKMAGTFLNQITKLSLKTADYPTAKSAIKEEIEKYLEVRETPRVGQLSIGLILVNLAQGDSVAALKDYDWIVKSCPDVQLTEDGRACEALISRYENGDDESLQNAFKSGVLRSMDNEYLRLMKNIHAPSVETAGGDDEDEDDLR